MKNRSSWIKLPTDWIIEDELNLFKASAKEATSSAAALMCLTVIAHEADPDTGVARVTYSQFEAALGKSRKTIASGLRKLEKFELVLAGKTQSERILNNYNPSEGWAKLPCKSMYRGDEIEFFADCNLRKRAELDAIKMMYLIVAFRNQLKNITMISYDKIVERTGIPRERIKAATSLLSTYSIAFVEQIPSSINDYGVANGYRLRGIDSYNHQGTRGRRSL